MKEDLALVDAEEVADRYKRVTEWVGQQSFSVVQFQDMPVNRSEGFAALTELLGSLDYDNILEEAQNWVKSSVTGLAHRTSNVIVAYALCDQVEAVFEVDIFDLIRSEGIQSTRCDSPFCLCWLYWHCKTRDNVWFQR